MARRPGRPVTDPLMETVTMGGHPMPGVWRFYLPEADSLRLPGEEPATCDDCFRAAMGGCRADCGCCTYFPQLPNTMVGLALQDPRSARVMAALIDQGHLLPGGLVASPRQYVEAVQAHAEGQFGLDPAQLCPFASPPGGPPGGLIDCAIYPYRNSICASYFCGFDHGEAGEQYWRCVQALVGQVESALSGWAMDQMGLSHGEYLARLDSLAPQVGALSADPSAGWPRQARQHLWGRWLGKEREFFAGCARHLRQHRRELYDIACAHPHVEATAYERALHDAVPARYRDEVPAVGEGDSFIPVEAAWYRLQLADRNLWALPFGEGRVALAPGVALEPNPRDDVASRRSAERPICVRTTTADVDACLFLTQEEADLLRLFYAPLVLGEQLFDSPEVEAVEDVRGFLARMMRQQILISL